MKEKALTILVDNKVRDLIIELSTEYGTWTITDGTNTGKGVTFNDAMESYKRRCMGLTGDAVNQAFQSAALRRQQDKMASSMAASRANAMAGPSTRGFEGALGALLSSGLSTITKK